jgi:asparagine synthase (glutamine-hydrolysing)
MSDVPLACALSGGLDSGAVVGLLAQLGQPKLHTFTLGFRQEGEEPWSELETARQVAARWGADHHELVLSAEQLLDDLVPMVWALDEPYGGGLPSWYVFRLISQDMKVVLTGTGGDELFGGYGKWRRYEQQVLDRPSWRRRVRTLARDVASLLPRDWLGVDRRWHWRRDATPLRRPFDAYPYYFDDREKREMVAAFDTTGLIDTCDLLQDLYEKSGAAGMRNGVAAVDLQTQLSEEFLLMTDRFSMAHSLEARTPMLDHVFAEQVLRIPASARMRPEDPKALLRRAVSDLLPSSVADAPKRGFVVPQARWIRGKLRPLIERLLDPERLRRQGLLKPEVHREFVAPHLEGRADFNEQIWTLMMLQLWYLIYVESPSREPPSFSWKDLA